MAAAGATQISITELPIIGSVESDHRWLILTTCKIAWCRELDVTTLALRQIVDAIVDLHKLQETDGTKLSTRELQVKTKTGMHTIEVEPGAPLSGVWNVLQNIGAYNRREMQQWAGTGPKDSPTHR